MSRKVVLAGVICFVSVGAMALALRGAPPGDRPAAVSEAGVAQPALQIESGECNPWTHLRLNRAPGDFRFAIVADRTGNHRSGVFAAAVDVLNLLQPEFVMSIGDLIEGYSDDPGQWALEWAELEGKVRRLEMPFFFAPGNHDLSNPAMTRNWVRKFGRTYYDFRYKDVLFIVLNSEDPPHTEPYRFSAEQQAWARRELERHADARWTFVFVHKPTWTYAEDFDVTGWAAIDEAFGDRRVTVFAGHRHHYACFERQGRDYIMLGTTGGGSKLRGSEYGEFDHIVWVTMKDSGPVLANVMLSGVVGKDVRRLNEAAGVPGRPATP